MAHIIYSKVGIIGEGKLNPAYDYISHLDEETIARIDKTKHEVEINEGEICLNVNNPVETGAIYCTSGYVSSKCCDSLHCWNSGSFYYNKVVFDKDISDLASILVKSNVPEDRRDSFLRLIFIGYFAAFDRYVIDAYAFFGFWRYNAERLRFEFDNEAKLINIRSKKTNKDAILKFFSRVGIPISEDLATSLDDVETFRLKRNSMVHFSGTRKECPYQYETVSENDLSKLRDAIVCFVKSFDAEMNQYAEMINPFEKTV